MSTLRGVMGGKLFIVCTSIEVFYEPEFKVHITAICHGRDAWCKERVISFYLSFEEETVISFYLNFLEYRASLQ